MTLMKKTTIRLASIVLAVAMVVSLIQIFAPQGKVSAATTGTWELTQTKYFAYKDGAETYVSRQNQYYKYKCYFRGVTDDNFVKFQVSGGYYDYAGNAKYNRTCDAYHLCSVPKSSYAAGGKVTLQAKNYHENVKNGATGGQSQLRLVTENKEADGIEKDPFFDGRETGEFYSTKRQEYTGYLYESQSDTFTINMPTEAKNGDRIAIVFEGNSAYDSYGWSPKGNYGGFVWYAWIYTYREAAPAKPATVKNFGSTHLILKWDAYKNADGYKIYRYDTKRQKYKLFKKIKNGKQTTYKYPRQSGGNSLLATAYKGSKEYSVKNPIISGVRLRWSKNTTATGYQIYRRDSKTGKYKKIKTIGKASTTSYTASGHKRGVIYTYKIRAYKTVNGKTTYSSFSDELSLKA